VLSFGDLIMTIVKRFLIRFTVFLTVWKKYFDPETGRDLVITINRNAQSKACVVTIVPLDSDVLSTGYKAEWLADTRTWRDVYAIKLRLLIISC
jgi:hypothetical protein